MLGLCKFFDQMTVTLSGWTCERTADLVDQIR